MTDHRRNIAVVTVGRSDYGIYRPVLEALRQRDDVRYGLVVAGAHLTGKGGEWRHDGHPVLDEVAMLVDGDGEPTTALSMGLGSEGFARTWARLRPDLVLVLGDRFEMFAAASALVPFGTPLAHLHGGEVTLGAMDERFRHAMTKLSHLHLVSTQAARRRVLQLAEEPWRVTVTGAPGLDAFFSDRPMDRVAFFDAIGMPDPGPYLLVTYHPVTTEPDPAGERIDALLAGLEAVGAPVLFTKANADPGGRLIDARIEAWLKSSPGRGRLLNDLGTLYGPAMRHASAMVGNSSSGIIEACSADLPVVNVGPRQDGRDRSDNLIDCPCEVEAVIAAVQEALTTGLRDRARRAVNVYGDGRAGPRVAERLASVPLDAALRLKRFHPDDGADG